jgi:hypothetical protein
MNDDLIVDSMLFEEILFGAPSKDKIRTLRSPQSRARVLARTWLDQPIALRINMIRQSAIGRKLPAP